MPPVPIPREIAEMDQVGASLRTIAEMCRMFYNALIEQGFTTAQADTLLGIWLTVTTTTAGKKLP